MLCRHCQKIQPLHRGSLHNIASDEHEHWCLVKHHSTFDELLASAANGCDLCEVFRPFVQSAKLNRERRYASDEAEDENSSLQSDFTHDDPFEYSCELQGDDTIPPPIETFVYKTQDIVYLDEGDQYCIIDNRYDEKNSALLAQLQQRVEEESKEDLCAGFPPPPSGSKRNAAIQWLLQDPKKYTGPEQLLGQVVDIDRNPGRRCKPARAHHMLCPDSRLTRRCQHIYPSPRILRLRTCYCSQRSRDGFAVSGFVGAPVYFAAHQAAKTCGRSETDF